MLTPFIGDYTANLLEMGNPPRTTSAECAEAFSKASALFFQNATLTGVPMLGSSLLPSAYSLLYGGMLPAFEATDPVSGCGLMELAFTAYFNAGVITWWPGMVLSIASVIPLATILIPPLSVMRTSTVEAMTLMANLLNTWITTGPKIFLNPTGVAFFV
jgi:hypothetical protein